jgi:PPOX class probable FMN-dependent enzyme
VTTALQFEDVITTEDQLREAIGHPGAGAATKAIDHIDHHFAGFIEKAPFVLIASSDGAGNQDISPKGDPAGFVLVLDEHTLAIPDRPGNRRADTFSNILKNPGVALFFMVPGIAETLRVQGTASIVRDAALRDRMAVNGKAPALALVVRVHDAFMHCAKCIIRSDLWDSASWPNPADVPSLSNAIIEQKGYQITPEQLQRSLQKDVEERLY